MACVYTYTNTLKSFPELTTSACCGWLEGISEWLIARGRPIGVSRTQRISTVLESFFELSQVLDWTDPHGLIRQRPRRGRVQSKSVRGMSGQEDWTNLRPAFVLTISFRQIDWSISVERPRRTSAGSAGEQWTHSDTSYG
jgi:hypothetical protein